MFFENKPIVEVAKNLGITKQACNNRLNKIYLLKEINYSDSDYYEVFGKLNLDALKSSVYRTYESSEQAISIVLGEILTDTGWTYALIDPITKTRTVQLEDVTAADIILDCCKAYNVEVEFDTLSRTVKVYQARGTNRGAYVFSDLNLKKSDYQSDTYNFVTRLYPYGKDGLTIAAVNAGAEYISNFQHSNKIIEMVWTSDKYSDAQALYDDAVVMLNTLSQPRVAFSVEVLNLASVRPEYSILDFRLGDSVRIIDKNNQVLDTQRIVKLVEFPLTPEKNKAEFSNSQIKYAGNNAKQVSTIEKEIIRVRTDLATAIDSVTSLITNSENGYVVMRYNESLQPYELLIMDTPDVATATRIWRWNMGGLGYSSTGYNGSFATAITQDGQIVANFVTTGVLNAALIKTGLLQSADGSSWINMENGSFSFGGGRLAFQGGSLTINYAGTALETALAAKAARTDVDQIRNYIRFDNGDIILGEAGNAVTLRIENDRVGFYESDPVNPVASFTDDKLTVTDAVITKSLRIGNFAFVPRTNGNISFLKVVT